MTNSPAGFIVSWKVPASVSLDGLRSGITSAGFDAYDMAPDLPHVSLVSRAAAYIAKVTSDPNTRKLARKVSHMTRQITRETADHADGLAYTKEAAIRFDDVTGTLVSDEPSIAAMLPETAAHVFNTRTANDITRIVQRIVNEAGSDLIPVREQGGAYFIPLGHNVISKIATMLSAIGGEMSTFACTIGHGHEASKAAEQSVANVITDYLLKQIGDLRKSVDELNETGIRSDVKSRRLTRVAELRERIGAYASLISAQSGKLNDALASAEVALLAKLTAPTHEPEATPEPTPEPVPQAA
jgi:hypothetical protein